MDEFDENLANFSKSSFHAVSDGFLAIFRRLFRRGDRGTCRRGEILPRRGDSHGLTSTPSNDASSRSSPLSQCKTRAVDLMVLVVVRS